MSKYFFINAIIVFTICSCGTSRNALPPVKTIHSIFSSADRLIPGNNVFLNGKLIGEVQELSMNDDGYILVKMKIDSVCVISHGSIVQIESDLLGLRSLEIKPGTSEKRISNMDTIQSKAEAQLNESIQFDPDSNIDSIIQIMLDTTRR